MKFEVRYTDGDRMYVLRQEDGQFALVDVVGNTVARSQYEETFLKLALYEEVTAPLSSELNAHIDDILENRMLTLPYDEEMMSMIQELRSKYSD